MALLPVGDVPGIPPPAAPVPGAETLEDVGRLRTYVHMLSTRRGKFLGSHSHLRQCEAGRITLVSDIFCQ